MRAFLESLIIFAGVTGLITMQPRLDAIQSKSIKLRELLFAPDRRAAHILALGEDAAAADLLWLRSVFDCRRIPRSRSLQS